MAFNLARFEIEMFLKLNADNPIRAKLNEDCTYWPSLWLLGIETHGCVDLPRQYRTS